MATCLEIITSAYRKPNIIPQGDTPPAEASAEGLEVLQSLYDEMIALGSFGRLEEVIISAAYTAEENQRIYNTAASAYSVTLPETIDDGAAENGVRPPRDGALVVVVGSTPAAFLYSGHRGSWDALYGLNLTDFAPLSERSRDGLASLLALRLCEANGVAVPPVVGAAAAGFRRLITQRNNSPRRATEADYY